jgi:hypothetical protein
MWDPKASLSRIPKPLPLARHGDRVSPDLLTSQAEGDVVVEAEMLTYRAQIWALVP